MICVVIPTLQAERTIGEALSGLTRAAIDGLVRQVVVVDGGSTDATAEVADDAGATVLACVGDRGAQLAAGGQAARQPWLLTLRQDARLLPGWEAEVARHVQAAPDRAAWFPLQAQGGLGRLVSGLARPGDGAALLVPQALYQRSGGFASGLAEARLAPRLGRPVRLAVPVLSPAASAGRAAR